jgi:anti-sigma B factor antagonist
MLERQDYGDVTVLRMKVQALTDDEKSESLFAQAYAVVDQDGRSRLVLNLDGVGYLNSAALGKLIRLMQKSRQAGGRLALCKVARNLEELFRVTRLSDILLAYSDELDAVRSFA